MCKVQEISEQLIPIMEDAVELEKQLQKKVQEYNTLLTNIDHELQLMKLNAPKLAKVMKYRQTILLERRGIKDQYTRIKTFNAQAQIKHALGHMKAATKNNEKLHQTHTSPNWIKDTGVVAKILNDSMALNV